MPTILLTGASGVVGSALLHELNGHEVTVLTHRKPVDATSVRGDVTRPWLGLHPKEYRELAARVDIVVHCAAAVSFTASPEHLHAVNVRGAGHVLEFVGDADARLVHGSTAYSHRAGEDRITNAYAASKATGEILVRESGLPAAIARISTVIGHSQSGQVPRLQSFSYLIGRAMWGHVPFLPCTPDTRADLVPLDIVASALAALATDEHARGEYWITAGPAALRMARVIEIVYETAMERARNDTTMAPLRASLFKPRLVSPEVYKQVTDMVLRQTDDIAALNAARSLVGLASAYIGTAAFPTSLGLITGGPPALSQESLERAAEATCGYLASFPRETWDLD